MWFGYDTRRAVLRGINIDIHQGDILGIVGPNDSGKSTLVKLLLGLYTPDQGQILINGCNIRNMSKHQLYSLISYIPQDHVLFTGTIMDNIRLGDLNATEAQVIEAAKRLGPMSSSVTCQERIMKS